MSEPAPVPSKARGDRHHVQYAVSALPTLWIIDRQGILHAEVDPERLEATIRQYLDQ